MYRKSLAGSSVGQEHGEFQKELEFTHDDPNYI